MAVWSDLLYMVGQEHQEEIRGLRRQFTWSVADVQNGMLVLRCGTHQIYFLFSGHDLSADALSKLKSDEFSTGWLVIPRTVEHRGTDTVVTGRALIAGEDIAGRLMTLGVLLDSKTAADDNPGKDAE